MAQVVPNKAIANCIRQVSNWSNILPHNKYDTPRFSPDKTRQDLPIASPKMKAMFDKIAALDVEDMRLRGHLYKHVIYSDVRSGGYGAKILAAGFGGRGYKYAYDGRFVIDETIGDGNSNRVAVLCSTEVYGKPIGVRFKKQLLATFNRRPDNVHGEVIRFIILDQGFKEGIDLFDVKYVHLFEPLVTQADEQQAIGRSTRFCGQKGIEFTPGVGWPLYVFRYENSIMDEVADKYDSGRLFELYLRYSGLDLRQIIFANAIEKLAIIGAVDEPLTKTIHNFALEAKSSYGLEWLFGAGGGGAKVKVAKAAKAAKGKAINVKTLMPPLKTKLTFLQMREIIITQYKQFAWPAVQLENQCNGGGGAEIVLFTGGAEIVQFTPSQNFLRNFFQPLCPYKGMLMWHSVGTGKTCTAIAIASSSFERAGYTILWVTRHTLKSDVWKNMFSQVCNVNLTLQKIPADVSRPLDIVSHSWMAPISYKQFSNMLLKRNNIYQQMVARNGADDPLRKTLVIIDEVHKLYAPDIVGIEKPDVGVLNKWIQHSYNISGADSARLLLMSATPYTANPMELMSILNMCRLESEAMPTEFGAFATKYLDGEGGFTKTGGRAFLNDITGYISYLNRSKDARQFAYPIIADVVVPMSRDEADPSALAILDKTNEIAGIEDQIVGLGNDRELVGAAAGECFALEGVGSENCLAIQKQAVVAKGLIEQAVKALRKKQTDIRKEIRLLREAVKTARGINMSQESALDRKCFTKI